MAQQQQQRISVKYLQQLGRRELLALHERNQNVINEWIRRMVIQHHRFDILAEVVLGYVVEPHHLQILRHQYNNLQSLILVWRGAGKTTMATVTQCIGQILIDPDVRILLASKTGQNAQDFLKEIKGHFESNEKLRTIFGNYVGNSLWDKGAIEVAGRTRPAKEPTINTVGLEGAVASKHYDIIIADDLVDEENSRTKHQRDKMLDWYYKMLIPTLNPPESGRRFLGSMHVIGTRYHYSDLYGHLQEPQVDGTGGELKDSTLIIPVISPTGEPTWPERFGEKKIKELRSMGIIRFNTQFLCDCDAMKGAIFRYDDCQVIDDNEIPAELMVYTGVDLAISEDEESDMFGHVTIGRDRKANIYVLNFLEAHLRFPSQTASLIRRGRSGDYSPLTTVDEEGRWHDDGPTLIRTRPIRLGVEANAYQAAMVHQLRHEAPDLTIKPVITQKDKVTRAWNLSKHFEGGRVYFRRGQDKLREHMVLFPGYRYKDLFDAFDIAVQTSEKRSRKPRQEPKLI